MKALFFNQSGTGQRLTIFFRITLAAVAGHLISIGGEFQSQSELMKLPGYPMALFTSILIAIIAIEHVNYSIIRLHRRFPFYEDDYLKISWQLITCVLAPFVTIFILATIYYALHGHLILDTMWTADHGWQVLFMLLILNMIFGIAMIRSNPLIERTITYIVHEDGINKINYNDNSWELDRRSLYDLAELLGADEYILNPKKTILRLDNIKVAFDDREGNFMVELTHPQGMLIAVSDRQRKYYIKFFRQN